MKLNPELFDRENITKATKDPYKNAMKHSFDIFTVFLEYSFLSLLNS